MDNPFDSATGSYSRVRPGYPAQVVDLALAAPLGGTTRAADLGAGTGMMTRELLGRGIAVDAVEPSAAMRAQLAALVDASPECPEDPGDLGRPVDTDGTASTSGVASGRGAVGRAADAVLPGSPGVALSIGSRPALVVVDATAEHTGLPDGSEDLVTCAQAWHWLDEQAASAEVHRILRPGGAVAIVWNQMDVSVPWIHRLSRIMRSGDVHRPDRPPHLGAAFTVPRLTQVPWTDRMTPDQLMDLGTTRSSYLRADPAQRRRMQANLRWYLLDPRRLAPGVPVEIPYTTLLWTARRS